MDLVLKKRVFKFFIPGLLPSANNFINANRKGQWQAGHVMKKKWTAYARMFAPKPKREISCWPLFFIFRWVEPDKLRDPDNIQFAVKFIFDGLVCEKVMPNDGWNQVAGTVNLFEVNKNKNKQGVIVEAWET